MTQFKRVTLQKPVETLDAEGATLIDYATVQDVWVTVRPISATERIQAGQIELDVSHVVRIRHRDDITNQWRVKWGDRILDVRSLINEQEEGRYLQLLCLERVVTA